MRALERIYVNGRWVSPLDPGAMLEVVDPATEEVIARLPACGERDADAAVRAAAAAFDAWASTPPARRAEYLRRIAEGLRARADEMARTITGEVGMPLKMSSRVQVGGPILAWDQYARLAEEFEYERQVGHSLVAHEPVGVVVCITPWNYPLHQITAKVAPALAAGCTVVLKPSEVAPINAFVLAEVVREAGLPAGVFNLVSGTGPRTGEALVRHPDVDMVSFTGSTRAGRRVAELAAPDVKRVTLELGGKSAAIVLDDADLPAAAKGTLNACFLNSGQTCSAITRMLVPGSSYEEVKRLVADLVRGFPVGDPMAEPTKIGPLVSAAQRDRVREYIRKGIDGGAELVAGGVEPPAETPKGYYVRPTVFGRVDPRAVIAQEEIFGPVLSIICCRDEDEAVRIANGTIYGLAGAVWSRDEERALRVARRMRAGQVDVNGAPFNMAAPFGGVGQSGYGRENGVFGMAEFLEPKAIQRRARQVDRDTAPARGA